MATIKKNQPTQEELLLRFPIDEHDAQQMIKHNVNPNMVVFQCTIVPMKYEIMFQGEVIGLATQGNDGKYYIDTLSYIIHDRLMRNYTVARTEIAKCIINDIKSKSNEV